MKDRIGTDFEEVDPYADTGVHEPIPLAVIEDERKVRRVSTMYSIMTKRRWK